MPTKSGSDVIFCLQVLSKTLTCTLHLSYRESIDHLCINPIHRIGLIHKRSIDYEPMIILQTNMTSLSLLAGRTVALMVFKLLLCLSSPNVHSGFRCFVFDVKILKARFFAYYVMTNTGANE